MEVVEQASLHRKTYCWFRSLSHTHSKTANVYEKEKLQIRLMKTSEVKAEKGKELIV